MADGRHLEVDISRYLSEKSDDFLKILYAAADFEKKVALDRLRVRQNVVRLVNEVIRVSVKHKNPAS